MAVGGAAMGSNAVLLAAVNRHAPPQHRGLAAGIVGAGGSAGQLLLATPVQATIAATGWVTAMYALATLALAAVPLSRAFETRPPATSGKPPATAGGGDAWTNPAFWLLCGGFFVCGFHVSFLLAHMPGVIDMCGLPARLSGQWIALLGACNVVGSLAAGAALERISMKRLLVALYALRALGVAVFLCAPKSTATMLAFAVWMGLTYMATLPPTSGLVGRLFGTRRLATLLGVVMLVHQVGAFLGVWLGGIAVASTGSYAWIWHADVALCLLAAALHLPLREPSPASRTNPMPALRVQPVGRGS
jgi:predicted MFS family arabinose efflux permease